MDSSQRQMEQPPVVHIGPTPFFANRGCHIRILNEIEGLRSSGRPAVLCTYGLGNDVAGIEIHRIPKIPGYTRTDAGFSIFKPFADVLLFFLVLKVVLRNKAAIIHGHLHEGGLIGWCVKVVLFWRRIELIMDVQGSLSGELRTYGTFKRLPFMLTLFYFVERLICLMPDKIVCSSPASAEFLSGICRVARQKIEIVGDVVPASFFSVLEKNEKRVRFHLPIEENLVIYTGSLLPGKGVDLLFEAIQSVLKQRRDCVFLLIGYPKEWLEKEVGSYQLENNVIVAGEVPYSELADWLATADLSVDPKPSGSGEASGKILHYMASGLATVCFATENNVRFLGKDAFYAAEESASALAGAIDLALTEQETRIKYGASCRQKAAKEFSQAAVGRHLNELYDRL